MTNEKFSNSLKIGDDVVVVSGGHRPAIWEPWERHPVDIAKVVSFTPKRFYIATSWGEQVAVDKKKLTMIGHHGHVRELKQSDVVKNKKASGLRSINAIIKGVKEKLTWAYNNMALNDIEESKQLLQQVAERFEEHE